MRAQSKDSKIFFSGRIVVISSILLLFTFFLAECGNGIFELNSGWRDREITVDGKNTDWLGAMMFFEEDNVSVGLLNDKNFFYICMIAEDEFIRTQVMRQGFTLWFDPDGSKEKTFGIKYPVGMQASDLPGGMRRDEQSIERPRQAPRRQMNELEILGPGKDEVKKMRVEEAKGIEINIEFSSGMLVYELKVPLIQSEQHPYAIGAEAGSSIGIGLETAKIERPDMTREMSGGRVGGGPTGGMRGGAGGRGMPGGRRPRMPQPLKIWAVVQLATAHTATQE
ncbi:MAG: hypothetical protein GTO16_11790 [Candidatus Aminicenantes bacterium]|nr:hypothetical protein [Candidatus Aminicenantes bacterium]